MLLDVALHSNIKAWKANNIFVVSFAEHWIQDGLIVTFSENIRLFFFGWTRYSRGEYVGLFFSQRASPI